MPEGTCEPPVLRAEPTKPRPAAGIRVRKGQPSQEPPDLGHNGGDRAAAEAMLCERSIQERLARTVVPCLAKLFRKRGSEAIVHYRIVDFDELSAGELSTPHELDVIATVRKSFVESTEAIEEVTPNPQVRSVGHGKE